MNTLDTLCELLAALGIPWANQDGFGRGDGNLSPQPPYIVLTKSDGRTHGANDLTWLHVVSYDIELYTTHRDYALEKAVSNALDNEGFYFSDGGTWNIDSEGLVEAVFTVDVREN